MKQMEEQTKDQEKQTEEDYAAGCFKSNYMIPHVCPIPTGGWCKEYIKCKNMEESK